MTSKGKIYALIEVSLSLKAWYSQRRSANKATLTRTMVENCLYFGGVPDKNLICEYCSGLVIEPMEFLVLVLFYLSSLDFISSSPELLEGRLNHLASQLQIAAKRIEILNEFKDMEAIVLARLIRDEKSRRAEAEAEVMKRDSGKWNQEGDMGVSEGKENVEVEPTSEILVERELLVAMKRCKKGMERSVIWQRDEFRRVEKALGRPKEKRMSDGSGELDIGTELRGR